MVASRHTGLIHAFLCLVLLAVVPTARADIRTNVGVPARDLRTLVGAIGVAESTNLAVAGGAAQPGFTVPGHRAFILTDIIISPQEIPASGDFLINIISSPVLTTSLAIPCSASDSASFQTHLTTGMVFPAGSQIRVSLVLGSGPVNVTALGYLVPM